METSIYVSLSGQLALQRRLETIANNIANASTPGFRAESVTFDSVISRQQQTSVTYSTTGTNAFSANSGPVVQTGNPTDVAIKGDALLGVATPSGTVYTRDGRMQISPTGGLTTINGLPVLDSGGAPVQINAARGPIQIAHNGAISQNGDKISTLGLFRASPGSKFIRYEGAGLIPDKPVEPVANFTDTGIIQGYLENSNVNPILEMTRLISVQRTFEAITASIEKSDQKMSDSIRTLGSGR
jgi:flagellar basal-body rod protein FlgF